MTRLYEIQTNFQSGEIDPKVRGQTDLKLYANGLSRMRNVARLAGGGIERRPGTLDLVGFPTRARLIDFEFSSTQRYVMAFLAGELRVFSSAGALLQTITGCPWTNNQLFELGYTQNGDIMIVTCSAFTSEIKRTGASTFTVGAFAFLASANNLRVYQPYYKFADDAVTISPSAATGSITLTASAATFVSGHIGQRFRIYDNEVLITALTSALIATGTVQGELKGKLDIDPFKSRAGSAVVEVLHLFHGLSTGATIEFAGSNDLGALDDGTGAITGAQLSGTFTITVIDENTYEFTSGGTASVSEDGGGPNVTFRPIGTPTRDWREPSINAVRGYPNAACFHEGRLWLAGTPSQPDGYFGSNALQHTRFDVGKGYDGDSVQGAAGLESLSGIRHLVSNGDLQLFTATAEGIFVTRPGEPITPTNQRIVRQSGAGANNVMPQVFDGSTIFVQENARSVSELVYSEARGGYAATPISIIASHLLGGGPVDSATMAGTISRAEQYAFFVGANGTVAVFHSMRSENIAGWGLWTLGGGALVRSIAVVGLDIFACVERAGVFRLYKFSIDALHTLDGAVEHTGASTATWTVDARLRNRTLGIVSERGYHGEFAIPANGIITLTLPVTRLVVGNSFFVEVETLPPRVALPSGARDRLVKRIVRTVMEFDETQNAVVDDEPLLLRQTGIDPSLAPAALTGSYEIRRLGFDRSPKVLITQVEPTPFRLLAITMEVKV